MVDSYLASHKILIVDPSLSSRQSISELLIQMGAKSSNILEADLFTEALELSNQFVPHIVISEYVLGNGSGIELAEKTRLNLKTKEALFLLVTSNSSQSLVARAAEGEIDHFFIKPFSVEHIQRILKKAIELKIKPSEYQRKIKKAIQHLDKKEFELAISILNACVKEEKKPTLALSYRGFAEEQKNMLKEPEDSYLEGLTYSPIHLRCLLGLFEYLKKQERWDDAYSVVKRIARVFPANPQRLSAMLSLAIKTGNVHDVEDYYQSFLSIKTRNEQLVKYICAALVVCAKYYLQINQSDRAFELLKKASETAAGRASILKEITICFAENGRPHDAEQTLALFPTEARQGEDYLAAAVAAKKSDKK